MRRDESLDPAEAARVTVTETQALCRAARRLLGAAEPLERAAGALAHGLLNGTPPEALELLSRYGACVEALDAAKAAMAGVVEGIGSFCFPFADLPNPDPRLRARALDELRVHLAARGLLQPPGAEAPDGP